MASAMLAIDHRNRQGSGRERCANCFENLSVDVATTEATEKSHHLGSAHVEMPSEGMISDLFKSRGHTINPHQSQSLYVYKLQKEKTN